MGIELDEEALAPVAEKLLTRDIAGASSTLAGILIGVLTGSPVAGVVAKTSIKGFAGLIRGTTTVAAVVIAAGLVAGACGGQAERNCTGSGVGAQGFQMGYVQ